MSALSRLTILIPTVLVFIFGACAEGGLDDNGAENQGAGEADVGGDAEYFDTDPANGGQSDASGQDCVPPGTCDSIDCGHEYCEPCTAQCVPCLDSDHCDDGLCTDDFFCVECEDDGDCSGGRICNTAEAQCVECLDESDCSPGAVCDPETSQCTGCISDTDCEGELLCDDGQCVGCVSDEDCGDVLVCDVDICVGCIVDTDCEGALVCRESDQTCVECVVDTDCGDDLVCDDTGPICVECVIDDDCGDDLVCDGTGQTCVECVVDDDCDESLVCDDTGQTCVECIIDDDCDDGVCHPDYPACVRPCCDFFSEAAGPAITSYFRGYGIAADSDGNPVVGIADRSTHRVVTHVKVGSTWYSNIVDDLNPDTLYSLSALSIAVAPDDSPHLVLANAGEFTHYWRQGSQWQSYLIASVGSGSFKYVDVGVDESDTAHMVGMRYSNETLYYSRRTSSGGRTNEQLVVVPGLTIDHVRMAVTDGGTVYAATRMSDATVYLTERTPTGSWLPPEQIGNPDETFSVVDVAVDSGGHPQVATSHNDGALIWTKSGGIWSYEVVSQDSDRGRNVRIATDHLGNPHLWYVSNYATDEVYYARREMGQWTEYVAGDFPNAVYWEFDVDDEGRPHAVARETTLEQPLLYVSTDD